MNYLVRLLPLISQEAEEGVGGAEQQLERRFDDEVHQEYEDVDGRERGAEEAPSFDDGQRDEVPQRGDDALAARFHLPALGHVADAQAEVADHGEEEGEYGDAGGAEVQRT